jgi:ketosteroid isomerase-like protein
MMKKLAGTIVLVCLCVAVVIAQTKKSAPAAGATEAAVKQLEHDWTEAMKAGDADKLSQILADDWTGLTYLGGKDTKQSVLADLKSKASTLTSYEFGPMDVWVAGNIAVVQGSDTEKSTTKGKDSSGKYVWMDVFVKRSGKWQAVRSQSAKVQ